MKRHVAALVVWLALGAAAPSAADSYADLVAKAERGEAVDYQALRAAYARSAQYDPYVMTRAPYLAALSAYFKKDRAKGCAGVEAALKLNYVEPLLHLLRLDCQSRDIGMAGLLAKLGVSSGLTQAVLKTGDGKSLRTAYRLVTFGEIGAVAGKNGVTFDGLADIRQGGHHYFLIEGVRSHSRPARWMKIFFNVDNFDASKMPVPKALVPGGGK